MTGEQVDVLVKAAADGGRRRLLKVLGGGLSTSALAFLAAAGAAAEGQSKNQSRKKVSASKPTGNCCNCPPTGNPCTVNVWTADRGCVQVALGYEAQCGTGSVCDRNRCLTCAEANGASSSIPFTVCPYRLDATGLSSICVDLGSDPQYCGSCSNSCNNGQQCVNGQCQ